MNYHCFKDIVSKNESGKTLRVDLHNQTKKAHLYATNLKQGAHIHQPTAWLSTSHMRTAISRGQWQPWTAVSPLLGLISMT